MRWTSMISVGFEPAIPAIEQLQTYALDCESTRIGKKIQITLIICGCCMHHIFGIAVAIMSHTLNLLILLPHAISETFIMWN